MDISLRAATSIRIRPGRAGVDLDPWSWQAPVQLATAGCTEGYGNTIQPRPSPMTSAQVRDAHPASISSRLSSSPPSWSDVHRPGNVSVLLVLMRRHGNIDMKRISSPVSGMLLVPLWPGAWHPVPCLSGAEEPRARPQRMYRYLTGAEMGCAPCSSVARVAPGSVQPQRSLLPPSDLQPRQ